MQTIGVLVMAYGGPNNLDEVEPYLMDVRGGRAAGCSSARSGTSPRN